MESREKNCENCRYYLKHYIKRDTKFYDIKSGHCTHKFWLDGRRKQYCNTCELWEESETKKVEEINSIKRTLENMADRLNEITQILKDV